ncbi:MAG: hypothetical protein NT149_00545 [Candidatus Gottesmanbacteria bacterium]|nr:hypothetical protein [Candidatus Gottesmanbacteria bacterium]
MYKGTLNTSKLYLGLERQAEISQKKLRKRHPHAVTFFRKHGITPGQIRQHAAKVAASVGLTGAMLFAQPLTQQVLSTPAHQLAVFNADQLRRELSNQLATLLPKDVTPLTAAQEDAISNEIKTVWGIEATASLQGERLNRSYGLIGAEQHLARFPGDSVENMAPGRGAWGYFAQTEDSLTQDLIQKEKWYVAVQTLYLPDWQLRLNYLRDWYKYRKVMVVNPANGKTVVADVADSGPADFTGKQYGGSPEVMAYLGLNVGPQKGPVVLFFVNDPNNEIPLGPVEYNVRTGTPLAAK